ncbi:MAG TPA: hypothetical protein VFU88_08520 [Ktedonobacterales bacterium]|nr:hypothetical protein [Ktedonobacterales bacterium]
MFDPRSAYSRRMWHYESSNPLSVAQLVSLGSLDARTAALLWLLVEAHQSLIVSGPTDPTPGVGKTTTLNALLGFVPNGSTLVYTAGMYEDFDWLDQVPPESTYVLANEVSDHLPIYMWGRHARKLLTLPERDFAIATSCHADTVADVLEMLGGDLRLPGDAIARLGVIVNIGLVGRIWPPRRRFLSVHLLQPMASAASAASSAPAAAQAATPVPRLTPAAVAAAQRFGAGLLPLALWNGKDDSFTPASPAALSALAAALGTTPADVAATLADRCARIEALAQGRGVGLHAMREAIDEFYDAQAAAVPAQPDSSGPSSSPDADSRDA